MPFQVECMYCGHRAQVPDRAYGASGECPKCANSFTLVPAAVTVPLPARTPKRAPERPAVNVSAAVPVPAVEPAAQPAPALPLTPRPKRRRKRPPSSDAIALPPPAEVAAPKAKPAGPPRRVPLAGIVSLLAVALALWCASAPALCGLVIPLASAGLLLGLGGLLLATGGVRQLLPGGAAVLGGGVVIAAALFPSLLGPKYYAFRMAGWIDPTAIHVVPLSGSRVPDGQDSPDWVDAGQVALEQGRVRVQVVSVTLAPEQGKSASAKKGPPAEALSVRLRTQRVEPPGEFASRRLERTLPRLEHAQPRLTDAAGKEYARRQVVEAAPPEAPKKGKRRAGVFPLTAQEEVFVFEAPPGPGPLRLEIPAEAWGGRGTFRFTIPAAMIRDERAGPGVSPPGPPGGK
jgi:hypothetical protein